MDPVRFAPAPRTPHPASRALFGGQSESWLLVVLWGARRERVDFAFGTRAQRFHREILIPCQLTVSVVDF